MLVTLLVSLMIASCGKNNSSGKGDSPSVSPVTNGNFVTESAPNDLLEQVNQRRLGWGLRPLVRDTNLDAQAQSFAFDMADGRNAGYRTNLCKLIRFTGDCAFMYRNDVKTAVGVVGAWMRSPERLDNLQNRFLERAGAAVALDREGRPVWVLLMITN